MKKIILSSLSAIIIFSLISVIGAGAFMLGDVDNDGTLSISDATEIQKFIVETVDFNDDQILAADVDDSGYVDILDVSTIQKRLADIIDSFTTAPATEEPTTVAPTTAKPTVPPTTKPSYWLPEIKI